MSNNNDGWKKIMNQFPKSRVLSYKWLNNSPTLEEFDLEDYNLNALYRSKKKFEANRQERIRVLRKEIPPNTTRGSFSWEGYVAILFMMGMVAYQFFSTDPTFVMFGFLAIGALFFFFLYYFRLRKKQIKLKKTLEDINARQRKIETEPFKYDDAYDALIEYANALSDHNAWKRRSSPSNWKGLNESEFQEEIISMFRTYGYDAVSAERRDISIIYEDECSDERKAIYCHNTDQLTTEEVNNFLRALKRNNINDGMMISIYGYSDDAIELCRDNDIDTWDMDDLLKFEKKIEQNKD